MQYMILIYSDEHGRPVQSDEEMAKTMDAWFAYTAALKEAGVYRAGDALESVAKAASVRVVDGKTQVLDGPFAETKEQLGGYYLIDVADADEAIAWAARCPGAAFGTVEVRPVMFIPTPA